MIRNSVALTMLLLLGACLDGPDGCSLTYCMRQIDPDYGKPKDKPLGPGAPAGPQEPMKPVHEGLPGASSDAESEYDVVPVGEGGVSGGGGQVAAPHDKAPAMAAAPRRSDPPTQLAYRNTPAREADEESDEEDYASDADQPRYRDPPPDRRRRAARDYPPDPLDRYGDPRRTDRRADRRQERREERMAARDRWERRDRVAERERRRDDRHADARDRREDRRRDRNEHRNDRLRCEDLRSSHAVSREERKRIRRECRGVG